MSLRRELTNIVIIIAMANICCPAEATTKAKSPTRAHPTARAPATGQFATLELAINTDRTNYARSFSAYKQMESDAAAVTTDYGSAADALTKCEKSIWSPVISSALQKAEDSRQSLEDKRSALQDKLDDTVASFKTDDTKLMIDEIKFRNKKSTLAYWSDVAIIWTDIDTKYTDKMVNSLIPQYEYYLQTQKKLNLAEHDFGNNCHIKAEKQLVLDLLSDLDIIKKESVKIGTDLGYPASK